MLKNLIKSENSLDFVISLCSSELSKIEHQNRLSLTTVSKKLLEQFGDPNSFEYKIFKDVRADQESFSSSKDLLLDVDPLCP